MTTLLIFIRMKILLLVLAIYMFGCVNSDSRSISSNKHLLTDTLKKYSYWIEGQRPINKDQYITFAGSGYFVRENGRIFFVTGQHVLNGCHSSKDTCQPPIKDQLAPDSMRIHLQYQGEMNFKTLTIDVRKVKANYECVVPPLAADVIAYEVDNTVEDTIYSIEKFLPQSLPKEQGIVGMYGFPSYANYTGSEFHIVNATYLSTDSCVIYNYYKFLGCGGAWQIDSVNYVCKTFKMRTDNLDGFSGSPVFVEDLKNKRWVFAGTFTTVIDDQKLLFAKPEHTLEAIYKSGH